MEGGTDERMEAERAEEGSRVTGSPFDCQCQYMLCVCVRSRGDV